MNTSINNARFDGNGIFWAITASMLLHVLVAVVVPSFNFTNEKEKRQVLKIELQQPTPPAPPPVAEPLPPINIPEPPKPEPIKKKPKPIIKPKPVKKVAPVPIEQPEVTPPPATEEIIAVQPTAESKPEIVVPPPTPIEPLPEVTQTAEPNDSAIEAAVSAFKSSVEKELRKNHRYPKMAERRGQQGKVMLEISISRDGSVVDIKILESSGYSSLDRAAIATVKRSNLKELYPELLYGRDYTITTPITFRLKDS